jgi:hypothetical protein
MISLNIVHQKLFYNTIYDRNLHVFRVKDKSTGAQHVLPEQKNNGSPSFARKTYYAQCISQKQINKTNRFAPF